MKAGNIIILICIVFLLSGCRGCSDEADKKQGVSEPSIDTTTIQDQTNTERMERDTTITSGVEKPITKDVPPPPGINEKTIEPGVIQLKNASPYATATPKFQSGSGGITQASISVKNTHSSISFKKVIVEVVVTGANDFMRSNFYTIVNLDPGESKEVSVPDSPQGSKMTAKVVKVTTATGNN